MEKLLSKFKDLSNKKQIENVVIFTVNHSYYSDK